MSKWENWDPPNVAHVKGRFTTRELGPSGLPDPQSVEVTCEQCGQIYKTSCASGRVRDHIQKFAILHLHRDPFATS